MMSTKQLLLYLIAGPDVIEDAPLLLLKLPVPYLKPPIRVPDVMVDNACNGFLGCLHWRASWLRWVVGCPSCSTRGTCGGSL